MQDSWGMVLADVDKHALQTWGTVQQSVVDRAAQWMPVWMREGADSEAA
jgi:hypothetical protein